MASVVSFVLFVLATVLGTLVVLGITALERVSPLRRWPRLPLAGRITLVAVSSAYTALILLSEVSVGLAAGRILGAFGCLLVGALLGARVHYQRSERDWSGLFYTCVLGGACAGLITVFGPMIVGANGVPNGFAILGRMWIPGLGMLMAGFGISGLINRKPFSEARG